jgi:hypothetical protein
MAKQSSSNEGQPTDWTLRFKHGRLTILLLADPLTPFPTLKDSLLSILRERYPKGLPRSSLPGLPPSSYIPIPTSPQDVALAILVDPKDNGKGWMALKADGTDGPDGGKGKGRASMIDCPRSRGLKDRDCVAFRFRSEDEDAENRESAAGGDGSMESEKWVVEWPSFDDVYGEDGAGLDRDMDEGEHED